MYNYPICGETVVLYGDDPCEESTAPIISGADTITVQVNEEFDPLEGVTATDWRGEQIRVRIKE